MALPPQPLPPAPPEVGVTLDSFGGLKNTVTPENLTPKQFARARNVDLDDLGGLSRRRGRTLVAPGSWHSVFSTVAPSMTFGVKDGTLVLIRPDYSTRALADVGSTPLAWVQVGGTAYFTSPKTSGKILLSILEVTPWAGPAGGPDFWHSPVVSPEDGLGQVGGRLYGPPPLGSVLGHHNGRIYIGDGPTLWATELFIYNYVDKTKNYRLFESNITGIMDVEDGVYVGTQQALYFLAGQFTDHVRTMREQAGVIPGTMVQVPAEVIDPEGRRFPDIPRQTAKAMVCMTAAGVVAGLAGGQTYNLTRNEFVFPQASRGAAMLRQEDGINSFVAPLHSDGQPADNARFGDYLSYKIIRAGTSSTST